MPAYARKVSHEIREHPTVFICLYVRLYIGLSLNERNDFIERVKKDIKKSGLPLEIEVSSILKKFGWDIQNQAFYLDEQENKPRAIDIIASRFVAVKSEYFTNYNTYLVIECKKSQKPWLFYTTQSSLRKGRSILNVKGVVLSLALAKEHTPRFSEQVNSLASKSHYFSPKYYRDKRVYATRDGIIPYEPFRRGQGKQIVTAKNQVLKATKYWLKFLKGIFREIPEISSGKIPKLHPFIVAYPVIVFEGKLLECRLEEGDFKVSEIEYVRYTIQEAPLTHVIEVVRKDFFKEYLWILKREIDTIGMSF